MCFGPLHPSGGSVQNDTDRVLASVAPCLPVGKGGRCLRSESADRPAAPPAADPEELRANVSADQQTGREASTHTRGREAASETKAAVTHALTREPRGHGAQGARQAQEDARRGRPLPGGRWSSRVTGTGRAEGDRGPAPQRAGALGAGRGERPTRLQVLTAGSSVVCASSHSDEREDASWGRARRGTVLPCGEPGPRGEGSRMGGRELGESREAWARQPTGLGAGGTSASWGGRPSKRPLPWERLRPTRRAGGPGD